MASEITTFLNEKTRHIADLMAQLDNATDAYVAEWNARPNVHPTNDGTVVEGNDGSDGRSEVTGAEATNIVTRAMEYQAAMGVSGVRNTILAVAVNTNVR